MAAERKAEASGVGERKAGRPLRGSDNLIQLTLEFLTSKLCLFSLFSLFSLRSSSSLFVFALLLLLHGFCFPFGGH